MTYLNLARLGKNNWWRYLLGFLLLLLMSQVVAGIPFAALVWMVENDENEATFFNQDTMAVEGVDASINFAVMGGGFIFTLLGLWLAVRFLHQRPFRSLITVASRINWWRVLQGAGIFLAITAAIAFADVLLSPADYRYTFQLNKFLPFLLLALLLIPIQAMTEELMFRGYLMQGLGLVMKSWLAVLLSSLLFALPHLANPETWASPLMAMLAIFITGAFLALITLRDGTLELAMGVHTANNLAAFLLVAPAESFAGMQIPAVFANTTDMFGWKPLLMFLLELALFWLVMFKWFPRLPMASALQETV